MQVINLIYIVAGKTDCETASNDSTSIQPTRRARIKPKICISSPASRNSAGRMSKTGQPSITPKTFRSQTNKNDDNQSSSSNGSGISSPNTHDGDGASMITVTANVHSEPLLCNQLSRNSQCKSVTSQLLNDNTSISISPENQNDKQAASAGNNQEIVTETSKSPSKTSDGTLLVSENSNRRSSGGTNNDTVIVDGLLSTSQSTTDSSSTASTLLLTDDGGSRDLISNNEHIVINVTDESSAVDMTSTSQVNNNIGDQLSTGDDVSATSTLAVPVTRWLSTNTDATLVGKNSTINSQPSNGSCLNALGDKTAINQNATTIGEVRQTTSDATGKSAPPPQQVRRARIRPKVRIATIKTPVEKALPSKHNFLTPQLLVEKKTANVTKQASGSGIKQLENSSTVNTGEGTSTLCEPIRCGNKESEKTNSSGSEEIASLQDSADRSVVEASANPSSTSTNAASQNVNSCVQGASKQAPSQPARRARIKPRVGIVDKPGVQTAKSRGRPSAKDKPSPVTSRIVVEKDSGQQRAIEQTKSVSDGIQSTQRKDVSVSGRDVGGELAESRLGIERGCNELSEVEVTGTIDGNERLVLNDKEKQPGQETTAQVAGKDAEQNISLTSKELSDKELHGVVGDTNVKQTSETFDPKDLSDSLRDDVILPQDNQSISRIQESSASPSCLPVMMEDSTILLQQNVTGGGLPSELGANNAQELLYNLETADDLLQSLLNAVNVNSGHVPGSNSGTPRDTGTVGITGNVTTQDVHGDPNTSMVTPSRSIGQEKDATVQISSQNNQAKSFLARIEPLSSSNETKAPAQTNETVTTSGLVTKRQRGRPKSRRLQLLQTPILDISSIPIASNIEIEQEISPGDGIDHPVLELPVDLQEDSTQSFPTASKSSDKWREKFQQRRSKTSKVVLSRKRSESSGVDKDVESGTVGDKTSASRDATGSSEDADISSLEMSISSDTNATALSQNTDGNKAANRQAYSEPNIQVRRKASKVTSRKRSTDLSRGVSASDNGLVTTDSATLAESSQCGESQELSTRDFQDGTINEITATVVDPEDSAAVETENSLSRTGVQDLSTNDRVEIVLEVTGTGQGFTNVVCESANAIDRSHLNCGAEKQSTNDCGSEIVSGSNARNNDCSTATSRSQGNRNGEFHTIRNPKASTPLHEVSSLEITLTSDATLSQSQTDGTVTSTGMNRLPPICSLSDIQDLSLNISESAIEEVILNTNEPLPDIMECPECPDLMLCLTTGDDTIVSERIQELSQTQPGTLEDNVARATRRTSAEFGEQDLLNNSGREKTQTTTSINESGEENGNRGALSKSIEKPGDKVTGSNEKEAASDIELNTNEKVSAKQSKGKRGQISKSRQKPKPNVRRKRKARGKTLDGDESLGTTGSNDGSVQQDTSVQDGSLGDTSSEDPSAQDASLGATDVQSGTAQGNAGSEALLEGSTPEAPSDPVQDGSKGKPGSRKRQGKAIKPKIPAKRGRKKAVAQETTKARDENGLESNTEAPVSATL